MLVRMRVDMSGNRDGVMWPKRGGTIELPDEEAADMVARELAVEVAEEKKPIESASVKTPVETASFLGKPKPAEAPPKLAATPPSRPASPKAEK